MLENLQIGDIVDITLRDKSTAHDAVAGIDRDGTVKFEKLGYRYRSGMEFNDHLSKKDIVEIKVVGAKSGGQVVKHDGDPVQVSTADLVKECNRLTAENEKLLEDSNMKALVIERYKKAVSECLCYLSRSIECGLYESFELEIDAILNGSKDTLEVKDPEKVKEAMENKGPEYPDQPVAPKAKGTKAKKDKQTDEGKKDENHTAEPTGDSEETGTAGK